MPNINRVRVAFSGFNGGPGVSTFYCLDPAAFLPQLRNWLTNFTVLLPATVTLNIESSGDIIDSVSGNLTGTWTAAAPVPVLGTVTGAYAAPVGMVVNWLTGTVLDGHRLRGRTFMVPLSSGTFENNGSLETGILGGIRAASESLVVAVANNFVIWHRPRPAGTVNRRGEILPARAGGHAIVTSSRVLDKAAVLRSRRD